MQFPLCPGQRAQSVTDKGIQTCGQEYCKCWTKQSNKLKDQLYRDPGYGGNILKPCWADSRAHEASPADTQTQAAQAAENCLASGQSTEINGLKGVNQMSVVVVSSAVAVLFPIHSFTAPKVMNTCLGTVL